MASNEPPPVSPFFDPGRTTKAGSLAILQLSRDNLLPLYLEAPAGEHDGYAEGHVINTRYGSFPHSTMVGVPWGSQIRASKVDTGSRGKKRKRAGADNAGREDDGNGTPAAEEGASTPALSVGKSGSDTAAVKEAETASSGFVHILPPTPENWTMSLPHRTQVVYTPDYSYVLHRLRARPGSRLIEAGAGSGSFSHASARAVYNGYPTTDEQTKGKVFSFEFHEERYHKMKTELVDHGLQGIVHLTHRDVYKGGFGVEGQTIDADAVFLDLPAPWEALPHLSRRKPQTEGVNGDAAAPWTSVLNPKKSVHLCTFSPCIEQVTRTVSTMRRLGWMNIEMVELVHRKLHTARERIGLYHPTDRGVILSAKDVEEAVMKLGEIEEKSREHNARLKSSKHADVDMDLDDKPESRMEDSYRPTEPAAARAVPEWMDGQLVIRGEPEIKTHTSYLVFAVLPQEWSEEDEAAALARWPLGEEKKVIGTLDKATRKQERREKLQEQTSKRAQRRKQGMPAAKSAAGAQDGTA